jgi:hypothetical protein
MWPIEARTVYPPPRYLPIVLALAGDSTITKRPRPAVVVPFPPVEVLALRLARDDAPPPLRVVGMLILAASLSKG